jgi:hypothetical protein
MGIANFLTLGAAGEVEDAVREYERLIERYNLIEQELNVRRTATTKSLNDLILAKQVGVEKLRGLRKVIQGLAGKDRTVVSEQLPQSEKNAFERIETTLNSADLAFGSVKGGAAGIATATGAWALAGAFGAASTGTAITSLGGAAAFNATLAWFGGGALAAGGGGMLAGAAALGGIVLAPAAILTGLILRSQAQKKLILIQMEASRAEAATVKLNEAMIAIDAIELRTKEMTLAIGKASAAFTTTLSRVEKKLNPLNPFTKLWHRIRRLLTGSTYSKAQLKSVAIAGKVATALAIMIDEPIVTQDGVLR